MKIKQLIERGDKYECHYCGRPLSDSGFTKATIDHMEPTSKGGPDNLSNAVLACKRCNTWKGSKGYKLFFEMLPKYLNQVENNPNVKHRKGRPVLPDGSYPV